MKHATKLTSKECQIIGSVLSQKLNIKLNNTFHTSELMPHLKDDFIRYSILQAVNEISNKVINKMNIANEIKSLNIKLNK